MKNFKFTDLLIGINFTLLFIAIAVVFTINFRPLYYLDVNVLNIEEESGLGREEIMNNYNTLIDYSSPFYRGELNFPTLEASESGLFHFKEVKSIFTAFYLIGAVTLMIGIVIIRYKAKVKEISYILVSSITAIVLPILLAVVMFIDFDTTFVVFHKLFFNNEDWIFDPVTDPVITILPDTFFLHCALLIISIVILFSISFLIIYFRNKKCSSIKYRQNKGLKL